MGQGDLAMDFLLQIDNPTMVMDNSFVTYIIERLNNSYTHIYIYIDISWISVCVCV